MEHIFIIKGQELITPRTSDGLLQGITRDVILRVANELNISTTETSLTLDELLQADECFLTGTGAELIPVNQINKHKFQSSHKLLYPVIATAFKQTVLKHCQK